MAGASGLRMALPVLCCPLLRQPPGGDSKALCSPGFLPQTQICESLFLQNSELTWGGEWAHLLPALVALGPLASWDGCHVLLALCRLC